VAEHARGKRPTIVDYACGPGLLLARIGKLMPKARLIGIDESQGMLDAARAFLGQELGAERALQVRLVRAALPDFTLDLPKADVAVFSFPDFRCDLDGKVIKRLKKAHPEDWSWSRLAAKNLHKRARKDDECDEDDELFEADRLFYERLASRNLTDLGRRGGVAMRVDYAPGERHEWIEPFLLRHDFSLGSWLPPHDRPKKQAARQRFTKDLGMRYRRSQVIRDVYAQNGDKDCLPGGYTISLLRAR